MFIFHSRLSISPQYSRKGTRDEGVQPSQHTRRCIWPTARSEPSRNSTFVTLGIATFYNYSPEKESPQHGVSRIDKKMLEYNKRNKIEETCIQKRRGKMQLVLREGIPAGWVSQCVLVKCDSTYHFRALLLFSLTNNCWTMWPKVQVIYSDGSDMGLWLWILLVRWSFEFELKSLFTLLTSLWGFSLSRCDCVIFLTVKKRRRRNRPLWSICSSRKRNLGRGQRCDCLLIFVGLRWCC